MLFPKSSKIREWVSALRNQNEGKVQGVLSSLDDFPTKENPIATLYVGCKTRSKNQEKHFFVMYQSF